MRADWRVGGAESDLGEGAATRRSPHSPVERRDVFLLHRRCVTVGKNPYVAEHSLFKMRQDAADDEIRTRHFEMDDLDAVGDENGRRPRIYYRVNATINSTVRIVYYRRQRSP